MYEEFKHPNPSNPGLYVYIEVPVSLLDIEVPPDAKNSRLEEEDRQKILSEYLAKEPKISLDGTKAVVLLNEDYDYRSGSVGEANIAKWDLHLKSFGLDSSSGNWMTAHEAKDLLETPAYKDPETAGEL